MKNPFKKTITLAIREPEACEFCSTDKAKLQYYEYDVNKRQFVRKADEPVKGLVRLVNNDALSRKCPDCGALRVKLPYQKLKIWWVTCLKCNKVSLSFLQNKCPNCNQESKETMEEWLASHTDK